jgi:hypothetical protein
VEVVLNPGDIDDVEFWGGKYSGYGEHSIRLWGAGKLFQPYLSRIETMPPGIDPDGYYSGGDFGFKDMI